MKKQFFALAAVAMIAGTVTFTSCAKEDTVAPVITITGGSSASQFLPATAGGGTWTNPTATATDDEDGEITTISVSGTVNPNDTGTYVLTYTCSDAAGNTATSNFTVTISNQAQFLNGGYNGTEVCQVSPVSPYTNDILVSHTENHKMVMNNFGGFGNTVNVNMVWASAGNISIAVPQILDATSSLTAASATYTGTAPTITVTYSWTDGTSIEACVSTLVGQ